MRRIYVGVLSLATAALIVLVTHPQVEPLTTSPTPKARTRIPEPRRYEVQRLGYVEKTFDHAKTLGFKIKAPRAEQVKPIGLSRKKEIITHGDIHLVYGPHQENEPMDLDDGP